MKTRICSSALLSALPRLLRNNPLAERLHWGFTSSPQPVLHTFGKERSGLTICLSPTSTQLKVRRRAALQSPSLTLDSGVEELALVSHLAMDGG